MRGLAILKFVRRRMLSEVYSCLLGIAIQCGIEDGLKVRRGHHASKWGGRATDGRWTVLACEGLVWQLFHMMDSQCHAYPL